MEKLIPVILILVLIGGGIVAWQAFAPEGEPEPQTVVEKDAPEDVAVPRVEKREEATGYHAEKDTGINRPTVTPTAEVGPESILQGKIVDGAGKPVQGAAIKLFQFKNTPDPTKVGRTRIEFDEIEVGRTTTDAQGRYQFQDELAGVTGAFLTMRATKDGFMTMIKDHVGPGMIVNWTLRPGASIVGRVIDVDTGEPVTEVRVEGHLKREATSLHEYARWNQKTTTGSDGRFELTGAPEGSANLMFEHPEYEQFWIGFEQNVPVPAEGKVDVGDIKLKRGVILEGLVVDAATDQPIKDAMVTYSELPFIPHLRAKTGVFGKFRMTGLKRGPKDIMILADGYTQYRDRIVIADDMSEKQQVFRIRPAGRARGQVVDGNGQPIANADIYVAEQKSIFFTVRNFAEARTNADGLFEVKDLGDGTTYRILAKAPDRVLSSSEGPIEGVSGETVDGVIVIVEKGASISGRVTDDAGVVVPGVTVLLEKPPYLDAWFPEGLGVGQKETLTATTDESGAFRFEGLYPGSYSVLAEDERFVPVQARRVQVESPSDALTQDFNLQPGNSISGRVRDAFGNAVANATVEAALERGSNQKLTARSDADGNYEIHRLSDRPYRVLARTDDAISRAVSDVPPNSSGIDFIVEKFGVVEGRVVARNGQIVDEYTVKLMPLHDVEKRPDGRWDRSDRMNLKAMMTHEGFAEVPVRDPNGVFRITKVVPGDYVVEINSNDFREARREPVAVTPDQTTVVPDFILNEGASLEGFVRDSEGKPVSGNDIQIAILPGPSSSQTTRLEDGQVETVSGRSDWPGKRVSPDANGFYSVGGLPPGDIRVVLTSQVYGVPEPENMALGDSGLTQKNFTVTRTGGMTFMVVDDAGQPVPNPQVRVLQGGQNARVDGRPVSGRPSGHGKVDVRKVLPGDYEVSFHRAGYETQLVAVSVKAGETTSMEVTMPVVR